MKKALLIVASIALIACKKEPSVDYAIISGKIINKPEGEITINSFDRSFSETLEFSDDGTFVDTLSTNKNPYVLYDGKNPVFIRLQPGDNLNISYDAQDFYNTLSMKGKGSEVSNYLMARRKKEQDMFGNANETYMLNEAEFKEKFVNIKQALLDLLSNTKNLPSDFIEKENRDINYFYLNAIKDYEQAHGYFIKNQAFKASEDFLKEFDDFNYDIEEDYIFSSNYKRILTQHFSEEAKSLAKEESIPADIAFVKNISTLKSEAIKNGLLFEFANYNMTRSEDIKAFYKLFMANSTNEENNKIITKNYNKLTALVKGNPSPKFVDYENYKGGTTSLDDLKGKYVYVDVWATWCGPCKREIPYLKEVENNFHDNNIEFVSVSIDKLTDHDKWQAMVENEALGGMQLMADNDWNSTFVKEYQIQGIPRFILIDPEGNIVDANAPRPSDSKLSDLLTSLNI